MDRPSEPSSESVESQPAPEPAQQDVLGLRISAALIDLVVLFALFLVLALAIGEREAGGGDVSLSLYGGDFVLYLALVLAYYLVLEAAIGQTVGKLVLGLRVVRTNGSRPSLAAITIRTLARIVDWLPIAYLIGFIAIMATGKRRARLGDLMAKTGVVRVPVRHRALALAIPTLLLVPAIAGLSVYRVTADSDEGTHTYRAHDVSFEYPGGWQEGTTRSVSTVGNTKELWQVAFVLDEENLVSLQTYRLAIPANPVYVNEAIENLEMVMAEIRALVVKLSEQTGGSVEPSKEISVAGRPGLRFRVSLMLEGSIVESTLIFVVDRNTEYFLTCQHTEAKETEIERGCDQIVRTFRIG
jgi:uncharacterized RDD family membrane protein YckC